MSSTSKHQSTDYALNIGCEIETLLSWSDPNHNPAAKNPTEFVSLLCNKFNKFNNSKGKTAMKLTSNMEDTTITEVTYATWTVTGDSTLKKEKKDVHYCKSAIHCAKRLFRIFHLLTFLKIHWKLYHP